MREGFNMILKRMNESFENQERIWRKKIEEMKREYRVQMVKLGGKKRNVEEGD